MSTAGAPPGDHRVVPAGRTNGTTANMAAAARRGRFAPSPTGPLHFGSLLAALASFCDARRLGAQWQVRIEDVDAPRSRPGAAEDILRTLQRYGFRWDGDVAVQSRRTSRYAIALQRLRAAGLAYPCACTRRELEQAAAGASGERVYPGTCRDGVPGDRSARRQRAWRVKVGDAVVAFEDRLQGPQRQALSSEVGDFVVKRADGLFAYQLAVVVDDAEHGVTDVVRGADLLASTPRQIHLQRALGFPSPTHLHIPIAILPSGEKLSKQTGAPRLPDDPLPALLAAWRFLDQPPLASPATPGYFWHQAIASWTPSRLPPVRMLPVPALPGARV